MTVFPHKLVRDRIPEIIKKAGKTCEIEHLDREHYQQALREKLIEEAQEAAQANAEDLLSELADLSDVIEALLASYHISPETLKQVQSQRQQQRGGFNQQIRLLSVSSDGESTNSHIPR
ncbi:MAG: nucleoside triphosphate pyrophosphohydrolase [Sodalinema sp.]|uniref:nucleoside triphosphate pyrophosphohydrolase n=1 Tax=Sodalinema sp. TaxID=3080550 RepID=UPI001219D67C|nr:MAG: nucleotide pyrophosphohydrolase [Phormidium sp. SL48-SHIP]